MITSDLATCLDEMLSASDDDRVAIRERILTDNDNLNDAAQKYTSNVPSGYNNWEEAYNGARSAYVKRLLNGSNNEPAPSTTNNPEPVSNTDSSKMKVSDLFK